MLKKILLVSMFPALVSAQTTITNFFDVTGALTGSVTSSPYGGTVYGPYMDTQGYFTTTSPRPLQPFVGFEQSFELEPLDNSFFQPFEPMSLDMPEIGGFEPIEFR